MLQFDLFGSAVAELDAIGCGDDERPGLDPRLDDYALLYTTTEKGNNSGIRFAMTVEDAMAWCSSPISQGAAHQQRWAYFWTSVKNFIGCHWGPNEPKLVIKGLVDNGQWDDRIASMGLKKIGFPDFRQVFGPLGVEVIE
jgi:hypothetical protein